MSILSIYWFKERHSDVGKIVPASQNIMLETPWQLLLYALLDVIFWYCVIKSKEIFRFY